MTQSISNVASSSTAAIERAARTRPVIQQSAIEQCRGATTEQAASHDMGYELFRRAIVGRDEDAWIEIGARYRAMLIGWASQCSATGATGEPCEDIADRGLARAWRALTPARFVSFPNLPALMAYLRACVFATAIDSARAQIVRERAYQKLELDSVASPEQVVLDEIERVELWQVVLDAIGSEQQRIVLVESFRLNLPPRAILARHPDLFPDIDAVYMSKRHLIGRLQRSPKVRRFLQGFA